MVGSTWETVTVVLGELQQEGLITVGRRKIVLTGLQKLAESVQREVPQLPAGLPSPPIATPGIRTS